MKAVVLLILTTIGVTDQEINLCVSLSLFVTKCFSDCVLSIDTVTDSAPATDVDRDRSGPPPPQRTSGDKPSSHIDREADRRTSWKPSSAPAPPPIKPPRRGKILSQLVLFTRCSVLNLKTGVLP